MRPESLRDALRPRSFRGRIVVSTLALMTFVMIILGVGVQVVLARTANADITKVLDDRMSAVVGAVDDEESPGPDLAESLEPGVRVYDRKARPLAGIIEADARDAADDLAERLVADAATGGPSTLEDDAEGDLRLQARRITTPSGWTGVVVVSQAVQPYERSELYALVATIAAGAVVILVSGFVAHRVTTEALAPVTRMAALATDWSEHDLGRRFDLAPAAGDELARLGASLDGLLDRVAGALRAEQRLTSELAHELRTPLTAIQGIAELGEMRGSTDPRAADDYARIAASARAMSETITTLLDLARHRVPGDDLARPPSTPPQEVAASLAPLVPERLALVVDVEGCPSIDAPQPLLVRCLTPLVENAVRHAATRIELRARGDEHAVVISVGDDGPGVAPELAQTVFTAGVSGSGGTGLGLAVTRRVATSLGGTVHLEPPEPGRGAHFLLTLPRG